MILEESHVGGQSSLMSNQRALYAETFSRWKERPLSCGHSPGSRGQEELLVYPETSLFHSSVNFQTESKVFTGLLEILAVQTGSGKPSENILESQRLQFLSPASIYGTRIEFLESWGSASGQPGHWEEQRLSQSIMGLDFDSAKGPSL